MLTERLASAVESYELEEEHTAIRDYLRGEMKKRGWVEEVVTEEAENARMMPRVRNRESVGKNCGVSTSSKFPQINTVMDRTGVDVLISSDEEENSPASDSADITTSHLRNEVDVHLNTSRAPCRPRPGGSIRHRDRDTVHMASSCSIKQAKRSRPLEQTTIPALISEEIAASDLTTEDQWLEDDMPFKKRRKQAKDPFKADSSTSSRGVKGSNLTGLSRSLRHKQRLGVSKGSSNERLMYSTLSSCQETDNSTVVALDSDESEEIGDVTPHHSGSATAHEPLQLSTNPYLSQPSQSTTAPPAAPATTSLATSLPFRIRVKIDTKSYLIPCSAKLADGSDSTIQWLAQQAAERYCTQHGVKPHLSLTTTDGALLSTDDIIAHVLQSGEEVVGMVEQWHASPLPQCYQTACTSAGLGTDRYLYWNTSLYMYIHRV